jgi:hypothetical protein
MATELVTLDYSRPVGELLAQAQRIGTIHSIFRRAVNIALDETLLVLLSQELPRMPNGMRLPGPIVTRLVHQLRPGMEVLAGDGSLLIVDNGYPPCISYSISPNMLSPWEPRPAVDACRWQPQEVRQHSSLLAQSLVSQKPREGLAPLLGPLMLGYAMPPRESPRFPTPLTCVALRWLEQLARASWRQEQAPIEEAVERLAGLGPGLTPSGDDVLGGFAAVMALLSPALSQDGLSREWIATLIARIAGPRTTLISHVLLTHAARGEVGEQIGALLLALALPVSEHAQVRQAAERVLSFGATSGADTLLGLLLGLHVLEGELLSWSYEHGSSVVPTMTQLR